MSQQPPAICSLRQRREFVEAYRRGRRYVAPGFILQMCRPQVRPHEGAHIGLGLTASRKVGKAVARNRARRRMRALARALLPQHGRPAHAYVLVARPPILTRAYQDCAADLRHALQRVHASKNMTSRKPPHAG